MSSSTDKKHPIPLYLIAVVAILYIIDQASKWSIVALYELPAPEQYRYDRTPVIEGSSIVNFDLVRVHNTGVAFGFGNGTDWAPFVFLGIQVVALVVLVHLFRKGLFFNRMLKAAWALIMVGVLGNMTDRLTQGFFLPDAGEHGFFYNLSHGYVVDFLDFSFPWIQTENFPMGYHWPSFNVADSCVCIAAALFFQASFFCTPPDKKKEAEEAPEKKQA